MVPGRSRGRAEIGSPSVGVAAGADRCGAVETDDAGAGAVDVARALSYINAILEDDRWPPRKQYHTEHRIWMRSAGDYSLAPYPPFLYISDFAFRNRSCIPSFLVFASYRFLSSFTDERLRFVIMAVDFSEIP